MIKKFSRVIYTVKFKSNSSSILKVVIRIERSKWLDAILDFSEKESYYSFWQIEVRWATHGIGFSEKIDFRRVVRLALAGGSAAADLISHLVPPSLLHPYVLLSRLYSNGKLDLPGSLLLYSQLVRDWRTISHGETAWVEPVVFLIFIHCTARWNCTPSCGVSVAAAYKRRTISMYVRTRRYVHSRTQ